MICSQEMVNYFTAAPLWVQSKSYETDTPKKRQNHRLTNALLETIQPVLTQYRYDESSISFIGDPTSIVTLTS